MDPDKRLFKYPNVVFLSAPIDSGSYPTTSLNSEADPGIFYLGGPNFGS